MKILILLITFLLYSAAAFAQLPDAPTPQPKPSNVYVPPKPYTNRETVHRMLRNPYYLTSKGVEVLAIIGDERDTLIGESHGCLEAGDHGPYHVSFGRMGTVDWSEFGGMTILEALFYKIKMKFVPEVIPLTFAAKHALGMYNWHQTGCLR